MNGNYMLNVWKQKLVNRGISRSVQCQLEPYFEPDDFERMCGFLDKIWFAHERPVSRIILLPFSSKPFSTYQHFYRTTNWNSEEVNFRILHAAALSGNMAVLQLLMNPPHNIDVRRESYQIYSTIRYAVAGEHVDIVQYLLERGADIHIAQSQHDVISDPIKELAHVQRKKELNLFKDLNDSQAISLERVLEINFHSEDQNVSLMTRALLCSDMNISRLMTSNYPSRTPA